MRCLNQDGVRARGGDIGTFGPWRAGEDPCARRAEVHATGPIVIAVSAAVLTGCAGGGRRPVSLPVDVAAIIASRGRA